MFFPKPYVNPQNKQTYRSWDMTKDGFTLLVMGYTGKKTMQFKLRYIEEFNRMEAKLKEQANAWLV
ncbi:phage regulatory protein, rha family [Thalassospira xiamenensis M-5 = DSM 17429]|nr:phage regulatory protein, rha family [Thalassospira xiamenensis M-5 = DSM 17429]